jgi:hypothetical protein
MKEKLTAYPLSHYFQFISFPKISGKSGLVELCKSSYICPRAFSVLPCALSPPYPKTLREWVSFSFQIPSTNTSVETTSLMLENSLSIAKVFLIGTVFA